MLSRIRTNSHSDITPFAKCPSCGQLIKLKSFTDAVFEGARDCPFCRTFISKKQIISSSQNYLKTTRAVQSAEHIFSMYGVIPITFGVILLETAIIYFVDWGKFNFLFFLALAVSVFMLLVGFLNIQNWLSEFGAFQNTDEEFLSVRKKVRRAQIVWVWANICNALWWFIYIKFL